MITILIIMIIIIKRRLFVNTFTNTVCVVCPDIEMCYTNNIQWWFSPGTPASSRVSLNIAGKVTIIEIPHTHTIKTFNFCTSRPDVCQHLVVHTPGITCQTNKPSTLLTHVACQSKLYSVVRSPMPRKLGANQAQRRVSCKGCPRI